MNPNPPIPGHKLLGEGKPLKYRVNPDTDDYLPAFGGCECGAQPTGWNEQTPVNQVQAWHRQHKDEIRKARANAFIGGIA